MPVCRSLNVFISVEGHCTCFYVALDSVIFSPQFLDNTKIVEFEGGFLLQILKQSAADYIKGFDPSPHVCMHLDITILFM